MGDFTIGNFCQFPDNLRINNGDFLRPKGINPNAIDTNKGQLAHNNILIVILQ